MNNCGTEMENNQTPLLQHMIHAKTGATLSNVAHITSSAAGNYWCLLFTFAKCVYTKHTFKIDFDIQYIDFIMISEEVM